MVGVLIIRVIGYTKNVYIYNQKSVLYNG